MDILERRRAFEVPLTIGVIADTHIYAHGSRVLPAPVLDLFRRAGVGLILHLGDVNSAWVLQELADLAPLLAVAGNNDEDELQDALPASLRFTVGPHSFGALHGDGGRSAKDQVKRTFGGKVDLAFFGHSHIPYLDEYQGTTLFNPGSATDRRWHEHFGVGIVGVTAGAIDPELILYTQANHLTNITFETNSPPRLEPQERVSR
jgi:putative phosphoesterase